MSVAIVGCGGIGLLLAASLLEGGEEVALLERTAERAAALQAITLERQGKKWRFPVRAFAEADRLPPAAWIVIAVKTYDTEGALRQIAPLARRAEGTILLQNGLPRYDLLSALLHRWLIGVTYQGATRKAPGHVFHAGRGPTIVGPVGGSADRATCARAATLFRKGGWEVEERRDIEGEIWTKLLVNSAINPLTAILRIENGQLSTRREAAGLVERIVTEGVAVAEGAGVSLSLPDPLARIWEVCRKTARNRSSMLQDLLSGRPTEIDALNGAIVREGAKRGIPTPVNETLVALIHLLSLR